MQKSFIRESPFVCVFRFSTKIDILMTCDCLLKYLEAFKKLHAERDTIKSKRLSNNTVLPSILSQIFAFKTDTNVLIILS